MVERSHQKSSVNSDISFLSDNNASCYVIQRKDDIFTSLEGKSVPVNFRKVRIGPKICTEIFVCDKKVVVPLDTGANISLVNPEFVKSHKNAVHREYEVNPIIIKTALGKTTVSKVVELKFMHDRNLCIWGFFVLGGFTQGILFGSDWTERKNHPISHSVKEEEISSLVNDDMVKECQSGLSSQWKFALEDNVLLHPKTATKVKVVCPQVYSGSVILKPNRIFQFEHNIVQPYVYSVVKEHSTDIWLINLSNIRKKLRKNTVVCFGEKCLDSAQVLLLDVDCKPEVTSNIPYSPDFSVKLGDQLTMMQKRQLLDLLQEFSEVFAFDENRVGKTDLFKHKIDTGDSGPIRMHPYRASFVERRKIREKVQTLLDANIIEESISPWAAPVVLVPKKDGSSRLCVDYRKLNAVTKKNAYPIPRMEDALDRLGGSQYFSILDLLSGFYQIEVDEADREKTAFVTPDGLYQFRRLPMGLCNSPSSFQYLMDVLLSNLKWTMVLVYLDDLVVFGKTFQEHLDRLRIVLSRLRDANFTLKPSKCQFGESKLRYLGHIISSNGVEVDPEKISAIVNFPLPKKLKEIFVRSLI